MDFHFKDETQRATFQRVAEELAAKAQEVSPELFYVTPEGMHALEVAIALNRVEAVLLQTPDTRFTEIPEALRAITRAGVQLTNVTHREERDRAILTQAVVNLAVETLRFVMMVQDED